MAKKSLYSKKSIERKRLENNLKLIIILLEINSKSLFLR